jgi:hypothetical protein
LRLDLIGIAETVKSAETLRPPWTYRRAMIAVAWVVLAVMVALTVVQANLRDK